MKNNLFLSLFALLISATWALAQQPDLQYYRGWDQDGINVFEPSKKAEQPEYTGFKIRIGGSFTQDFQSLTHENKANYVKNGADLRNRNILYGVATTTGSGANTNWSLNVPGDSTSATLSGFNLAMANLNFDFQIGDGIRVALENYMSSRHHSEFWVKGGYIQIDKLPMLGNPQWFADYLRVKIGHFQPNYGDMQFRRTDGGNTMFNPFVENYIMDAFTTEIGGEVYLFPADGFMAMVGMTSGFINGNVEVYPEATNSVGIATKKNPSIFAKMAFDKAITDDFRFRLSASIYNNANIQRNTLYAGDRTGSHYFLGMEPALQTNGTASTAAAQFTSGRFNPNFANRVRAIMINPFVKFKGLEVFGTYEIAAGAVYGDIDTTSRSWENRSFDQIGVEAIYRFLPREQMYVGVRYNTLKGEASGVFYNQQADGKSGQAEVGIDRLTIAAGWFPTKNLLLKGEYVIQNFTDFPALDYRFEGKFSGFMVQAVIGF
ncbi:MAG: hypothetical protein IPM98_07420 [Lewinellaceae bacterium]|nr:hypothetical protein [Lewinellaceae bacterium]